MLNTILENLFQKTSRSSSDLSQITIENEPPLRLELFSADQMEQHGKILAGMHELSTKPAADLLLKRLAENESVITKSCNLLTQAVKENHQLTPAGDWLLDNFYLIEEQIRTAKRHLPKGYNRSLPRLLNGSPVGLPRVYDIALSVISHGDGRVDQESLDRFITAYQTVSVLKLGELWAIPIMLRLALIENLRRVAARLASGRIDRDKADYWAEKMIEIAEKDPKSLILTIADMAGSDPPMVSSFVAELARRLQGQSPALSMPLTWVEQRLAESGLTTDQMIQSETRQQAADQVSISNSIGSLRLLSAIDWNEFVEAQSMVEQVLRTDPAGVYAQMDFATRDRYRHVIERIAKDSHFSEANIARQAIQLAGHSVARSGIEDRASHVGYYLIDLGLSELKRMAHVSHLFLIIFGQPNVRLFLYLGSILFITAGLTNYLVHKAHIHGLSLVLLTLLLVIGISQLAVTLVNWWATLFVVPNPMPRLDFSLGIPDKYRTLIAVPTMLSSVKGVEVLVEALEVRFLANKDEHLHFALLTDFVDAPTEALPDDQVLLQTAEKLIKELNQKYDTEETFFLFHRPRTWHAKDKKWLGYERKRGKLAHLNAFLRSGDKRNFSSIVGKTAILSAVKYVITLDSDTQLPRETARLLIETMAHPLNWARYSKDKQRIVAGYGILQPRMAVSLPGANFSLYAKLYGSDPGVDPYTRAVSDVYQDLFGEGSYIGKGIYDVDAFEGVLKDHFPENRILSHDLLEGCYVRSGLISDVELYEKYPSCYLSDVNRRHRWMRGDWQILEWLLPNVPGYDNHRNPNPLTLLSRWKIFDNLRRSLTPVALTLLLLLSWAILPAAGFWTLAIVGILLIPPVIIVLASIFQKAETTTWTRHLIALAKAACAHFAQAIFALACLPYEALFSFDAILRTAWRLFVTHEQLLAWEVVSYELDHNQPKRLGTYWWRMVSAPILSTGAIIYLLLERPATLVIAAPVLALWVISPVIAWLVSRPISKRPVVLKSEQYIFLRKVARKTWMFFETLVGEEDHWLPPDNYQEYPANTIAHRTSPTNIGMALLSNLSAHDFGYITGNQLIERTSNTLSTMATLERYRGHFYNWYDTLTLKPLYPTYVSTVDSGNLTAHLLTLRSGLLTLPDENILQSERLFIALQDTLSILNDLIKDNASINQSIHLEITQFENELKKSLTASSHTLSSVKLFLEQFSKHALAIANNLKDSTINEVSLWTEALLRQCNEALKELTFLVPWLDLPDFPQKYINFPSLNEMPTLRALSELKLKLIINQDRAQACLIDIDPFLQQAAERATQRISMLRQLAMQAKEVSTCEYDFLFDKARHFFAIGFNTEERRLDASFYDLLASEARLSNFVAIAQGDVPQESWFSLGRLITNLDGKPVLLSWSGSMFEYLMPLLVMPTYENTLLDETYKAAVIAQIKYGKDHNIPWGISESGYNLVDAQLNYQYRAFGVPGLGLKRGLAEDLVIAPYASVMALMVLPEAACVNLQILARQGLIGQFGFYEASDYTPSRIPAGQTHAVVRSFMAHHQGMSFLSLAYLLLDKPMQKRFEADPSFQATNLLLQEKVPKTTAFHLQVNRLADSHISVANRQMPVRIFNSPDTTFPAVQLLSNGKYHVMVTNSGGGYSRWQDIAVTRWQEDTTCDNWGSFCYIRDLVSGEFWSSSYQPTGKSAQIYEAIFSEAEVRFHRQDHGFDTQTKIVVSPEDDIELRRVRITNRSHSRRIIDITSYAEVVLNTPAADALHPAFSNLFVQTEIVKDRQAILCHRRPRSQDEKIPWLFHLMAVHGAEVTEISYETDRMRFIGRGNTPAHPDAMRHIAPLSGTAGPVLDPIVAIRYCLTLQPEESVTINIVTGIGESKEICQSLIEKYHDRALTDRVFDVAWTHNQVILQQINASEADAQLYGRLASSVIYANSSLRAEASTLIKNRRGQSGLWGYAISGDLPIVILQIKNAENIDLVRQLVQAHAYWRLKGLAADLVIWNEDHASYRQVLQDQIMGLVSSSVKANIIDRPGGVFVRLGEQISNEDRLLFQAVARIIISDSRGKLVDQIGGRSLKTLPIPRHSPIKSYISQLKVACELPKRDLLFFNGLGGFTQDGREYVINTAPEHVTPAPWVNVIANPYFGTVISENGLSYTWSENAHEFRLTPWYNDPVCDTGGEAFYLRDEETGYFWSPTPLPVRGESIYNSRHGFGYSIFEHTEDGITSELCVYVALDASIKFSVLKVKNESGRPRKLSATGYVEWALGDLRSKTGMYIVTELDAKTGAIFAINPYSTEFGNRVAFFDVDDIDRTISGDRTEFIGRNGSLSDPAALKQARLSGRVGAGMDPCAAIQVSFELANGQEREIAFRLGAGQTAEDASNLVYHFRGPQVRRNTFEMVNDYWKHALSTVVVETPDPSLNVLANGWLLYQIIASRLWARSGYYQSGGAFGFRDQLQDTMSLIHAEPRMLREQILLCASRQFVEGDVQHWWHPPSGRGVRTHCSDDYLWLPLATWRYVISTGDTGVLDEPIHFLTGRLPNPDEESYYDLPGHSDTVATLYDHCVRAVLRGLRFGSHGLPLMGCGDWNDGMNLVGAKGRGESVWLAFFLYQVLLNFAEVARLRSDMAFVERCHSEAAQLKEKIEQNAWDGNWYRRAYFDDGTPLGSASNPECQIDSLSQSWAVLSGVADSDRAHQAMKSLNERLVKRDAALIQLLDPPFDQSNLNPGYIKGYVPGVRENGGQYTHAAVWSTMAFAALGENEIAWELFNLINPVNHGGSATSIDTYKVEPYVMAADVYAVSPHTGHGGWTWYTGSAGWTYRLIIESLLGLKLEVNKLRIEPCLPPDWKTYKVSYRYRETTYHITIVQAEKSSITVDGIEQSDDFIPLVDDHKDHNVEVRIRPKDISP